MYEYKNLLLPTDLTEASEPAAERAKMMIRLTGADLTVLHIVDYVPPLWVANELPDEFATAAALKERAQTYLSAWMEKLDLEGRQRILTGSAKRIIVETARETGCDLIVMGTHGDRGIARIVGSTARGVLHDAPCDVLVVHLDKP